MRPSNIPPEPYSSIIDDACARDAKYFKLNPSDNCYVRPYCPGEFYPSFPNVDEVSHVEVIEIVSGVRARQLIMKPRISSMN